MARKLIHYYVIKLLDINCWTLGEFNECINLACSSV